MTAEIVVWAALRLALFGCLVVYLVDPGEPPSPNFLDSEQR